MSDAARDRVTARRDAGWVPVPLGDGEACWFLAAATVFDDQYEPIPEDELRAMEGK